MVTTYTTAEPNLLLSQYEGSSVNVNFHSTATLMFCQGLLRQLLKQPLGLIMVTPAFSISEPPF